LLIYNSIGQVVKVLKQEELPPGMYQVHWDGTNSYENEVSGGVYFAHLVAGRSSQTIRMNLVK